MRNILKEIEEKYQFDNILAHGEQVWPFLRITYFFKYIENISERKAILEKSFFLKSFKNIFYGWKNWFKRYDYIVLSSSRQSGIKEIKGKYFNRCFDLIIDKLGKENVLYIEKPQPVHQPIDKVYTRHISSCYPILMFSYIFEKFFLKSLTIEGCQTLKLIKQKYCLKIKDHRIVKSFYAKVKIFKLLYYLLKPKVIFVVCYYCSIMSAAVKAAKDMKIKVIEIQHGTIGSEHGAYNIYVDLDKSFFPDYFLVFGKRDTETFKNSRFIEHEHVYPVGSFYIEYIKENFKPEKGFLEKLKEYRKIVGVTLQWTVKDSMIEFIRRAANLDETIGYILIPRPPVQSDYSTLDLPDNVMVLIDKDFYELMMYVDFHSTAYSTCALEAPSLGVQNIMINIHNLSKIYFDTVLTNEQVVQYVDTPEEFVEVVNTFKKLDRNVVCKLNEDIIVPNYRKNIKNLINMLDS